MKDLWVTGAPIALHWGTPERRRSLTIVPGRPWRRRRFEATATPADRVFTEHAWYIRVPDDLDDSSVAVVTYRCAGKEQTGRYRSVHCRTCGEVSPTG